MAVDIHPSSIVNSENIGDNTKVWQYCVILEHAKIGRNCNINYNVFIENDVLIGNNVTIKSGVQIWDGIRIDDNVFIGPNVTFTNDLFPRSKSFPSKFVNTFIDFGASIGANSTIIAGNRIGEYSLVGAGSVVTSSIPPYTVFYGNPARFKGYVTKNGTIVSEHLTDKQGNRYSLINGEPLIIEND